MAVAASQMVFGPLRAIMAERDADKAKGALKAQLVLCDRIMTAPTATHPLIGLVSSP